MGRFSWYPEPPMPTPHRKRDPKPARRRALELLASCRDGCTEAMMLAHGFTIEQICKLVYGGAQDDDLGTALFGRPLRSA
jgi:hypothetical protein